jgi:hypothetical protein
MAIRIILVAALLFNSACSQEAESPAEVSAPANTPTLSINDLAEQYLVLELSMGEISPGHVDAYFGPKALSEQAKEAGLGLEDINSEATALKTQLMAWETSGDAALEGRVKGLVARLIALETRIEMQQGQDISFDEEVERLFATSLPPIEPGHFDSVIAEIDALVPGDEALHERVDEFMSGFDIPAEKLPLIIDESIAECKRRTEAFMELPEGEKFTVEYVTDKPWGGYNWYQGDSISLIQINTDLPKRISDAVILGCHEGYPGHHVYNALLEQNMVNNKGWIEFSLYPLFSPQSLIAEGSGNYGIDLAFPGEERIGYEKEVLFPMAGLDPELADDFYRLQELQAELNFARNEIARDYLNGDVDAEQTVENLMTHMLVSRDRAEQYLEFIEGYRSYVINYNHGKAMVAAFIERDTQTPAERWAKFQILLSNAVLPKDLED